MTEGNSELLELTADVVAAHVGKNKLATDDLPALIKNIYQAFVAISAPAAAPVAEKPAGAVSIRKSTSNPDFIVSLIDGRPYKALKRHLAGHGHTPETYRDAYGLARDYPMVAPSYAEKRRNLAISIGLGKRARAEAPAATGLGKSKAKAEAPAKTAANAIPKRPRVAKVPPAKKPVARKRKNPSTE